MLIRLLDKTLAGLVLGFFLCICRGSFAVENESNNTWDIFKEQIFCAKARFVFPLQEIQIGDEAVHPKVLSPPSGHTRNCHVCRHVAKRSRR